MIRLDSTSRVLQAVLGGAVTTNQLQCVVSYFWENNQGYKTRGATKVTNTNSTTDVNIADAPPQAYVSCIDTLTIYNKDTVSATVTVKIDDGGTETILVRRSVPPSGTLSYDHLSGWSVTGDPLAFGSGVLVNGKISTSVGSNALTVAVKTIDGNDPSNASPVYVRFSSSTLSESGLSTVAITSALSVVVSSGSTLGHASNIAQHIFVYLINNAGAAELAVSNLPPDYPGVFGKARLVSTTAEGGAGAADSATGVYSTTARSNVPWVCVAKMLSTQATAGTWASNMTQVDQAPFTIPTCAFRATGISSQSFADNTFAKQTMSTENYDSDSTYDSTTNYRHQPNVAGLYRYRTGVTCNLASSHYVLCALFRNGSEYTREQMTPPAGFQILQHGDCVFMNGTTDYMEAHAYQNSGGTINLDNSYSPFTGERIPQ